MKTNILFLVLLALITFSCKTIKQTSTTDLSVKTAANLSIKQTNDSAINKTQSTATKLTVDSSKLIVDKGITVKTTVEETKTTNLSAPDSTGKQYPTSITDTKRIITEGEQKNLTTDSNSKKSLDNKAQSTDKSDYKSAASIKDKGKSTVSDKSQLVATVETKTPGWVYVLGLILSGGVIYLIYLGMKRFNIIK